MPKVNPKILKWARETAGLSVEEAVKKLNIRDAYGLSADERLNALENGKQEPTRPMIVKMAKQYRRPLLAFYMSSPPRKGDRGQDFRTLPDNYSQIDDYLIDTLIRDVSARQSMIRAVLEEDEEVLPLDFIGSFNITDGLHPILKALRDIIKLDLHEFRSQSNSTGAFTVFRTRVQEAGIFVLLIGNLGSHHTSIDVDIFRGFALADDIAPFIIINDQDSHSAWSFTLIHELVHLLLGQTGISGGNFELEIESFCNLVAGEFLIPSEELEMILINNSSSLSDMKIKISQFARVRNISSSMVAYKLYQTGIINLDSWNSLSNYFRRMWIDERTKRRKTAREAESGPSYYIIRKHRLGTPLISLVKSMMATGSLSTSKAGKILGVKAKNVQPLFDTMHQSNRALGDI